jgi:hypothetical protein
VPAAKVLIEEIVKQYPAPTLIHITSASHKFAMVEGFIVYTSGWENRVTTITGYQAKTADVKPKEVADTTIFNGGAVLIRGNAAAAPRGTPRPGWTYLSVPQVRDLLGFSLLRAMPRARLK